RTEETVLVATFDRLVLQEMRTVWGLFRDRRPELYMPIITMDGFGE
ncbi:MAG: N-carbamoylputrescine amidase, partial [Actinomycetota bacterium]